MIRHIVLIKFQTNTTEDKISEIFSKLSALTKTISGARNFTGGRSNSPEQIERGYMHAFVIDFDSWADLKAYAEHPEHLVLGSQIVEHAVGGIDGLIVLDIQVND